MEKQKIDGKPEFCVEMYSKNPLSKMNVITHIYVDNNPALLAKKIDGLRAEKIVFEIRLDSQKSVLEAINQIWELQKLFRVIQDCMIRNPKVDNPKVTSQDLPEPDPFIEELKEQDKARQVQKDFAKQMGKESKALWLKYLKEPQSKDKRPLPQEKLNRYVLDEAGQWPQNFLPLIDPREADRPIIPELSQKDILLSINDTLKAILEKL